MSRMAAVGFRAASVGLLFEAFWFGGIAIIFGLLSTVMRDFDGLTPRPATLLVTVAGLAYSVGAVWAGVLVWPGRSRSGAVATGWQRLVLAGVGIGNVLISGYASLRIAQGPADGPAFFALVMAITVPTALACFVVLRRSRENGEQPVVG